MLDRAARREYNRLVEAAVDAVPASAPKGVFTFMRRRVKKELAYGAERYGWEFMLMSHLWALMGYQDAVRLLCEAMLYRAVNSEPGREAPNGISYAALAWPAEYVNLIGYAHLFNRTTTPFTTLSKEIYPIYSTDQPSIREVFGTPDEPGDTIKELLVPLIRQVIDEMIDMSIFRLSANGNDLGWDRAHLDEELERDARALRNVLGTNPETPHLPQDLNITLPEGFTTLHSNIGPNQAAPGLQHLPPPHPLPTNLFPPNWFTTPAGRI